MSQLALDLFRKNIFDKTADFQMPGMPGQIPGVEEVAAMEPVDDDSLTFGDVAESGCPVTQELLSKYPELVDMPYNETVRRAQQSVAGGLAVPAMGAAAGGALGTLALGPAGGAMGMGLGMTAAEPMAAAAGGGSSFPLGWTLGGAGAGALGGGLLGNYIGSQWDGIDRTNATLLGAGLGAGAGFAGGYLLDKYFNS